MKYFRDVLFKTTTTEEEEEIYRCWRNLQHDLSNDRYLTSDTFEEKLFLKMVYLKFGEVSEDHKIQLNTETEFCYHYYNYYTNWYSIKI